MLLLLFKIAVLTIFVLECFVVFTINQLIDLERGEEKTNVAFNLITGYLIRVYMLYSLVKGMGLL
jgi:hypothetical protein